MTENKIPVLEGNDEATVVDPQAVADLMQALERVFRIGVYYPAGHSLCDQAAEHFLGAVSRVVHKSPFLRFEVIGDILHVQGLELDPDLRGVEHFQELLNEVGISGVDIDSEISSEDLHGFVTKLLAYRNLIKGARSFQQVEIADLPTTVRIHQREFFSRTKSGSVGAGEGDPSQPSIETLLSSLARQGLTADQIAQCRRLLEAIPSDLEECQTAGGSVLRVTWADVEKLLLRSVRLNPNADWSSSGERPKSHQNLDALASMFESLGKETSADNSRDAIDLLVNLTRRSALESANEESTTEESETNKETDGTGAESSQGQKKTPDKSQRRNGPDRPGNSQDDLLATLHDCVNQAQTPVALAEKDHREELSILMQMLSDDHKQRVQVRIQKLLRDSLTVELQADEWHIVVAGVRQLVKAGNDERLTNALLMITDTLRRSEFSSALTLLCDVCPDCSPDELVLLWPHVVNEILVSGKRPDAKAFLELCEVAVGLPPEAMAQRLPRLQSLGALRDKHIAPDIFEPPPKQLFPVFAQILSTSQAAFVAERLVRGIRRAPPGWIGEAVVPLIDRFHPKYRRFMIELLQKSDNQKPSAALTENAGRIIAELLPTLPPKRRREPWVTGTIRSVSRLPVADAQELLHGILTDRHLLVFHDWPGACREAAREALADLKQRTE